LIEKTQELVDRENTSIITSGETNVYKCLWCWAINNNTGAAGYGWPYQSLRKTKRMVNLLYGMYTFSWNQAGFISKALTYNTLLNMLFTVSYL